MNSCVFRWGHCGWIKAYIQNQLEEDKMSDQISIKEFIDPFTGSKNPKA